MPKLRIAINGLGRIGRLLLRQLITNANITIVAVNDLGCHAILTQLLNSESMPTQPNLAQFQLQDQKLIYNQQSICFTKIANPNDCPWQLLAVDLVIEATGIFTTTTALQAHLQAGAKQVLLTSNFADQSTTHPTLIYNFNHQRYRPTDQLIAAGSCGTNSLVITLQALLQTKLLDFTAVAVTITHAATNRQALLDRAHSQMMDSRGILNNIIPATTKATLTQRFFPQLQMSFAAVRVPVVNGALINLHLLLTKPVQLDQLWTRLHTLTNTSFQLSEAHLVATAITNQLAVAMISYHSLQLTGPWLQLAIWFDNEVGYVYQVIQLLNYIAQRQ